MFFIFIIFVALTLLILKKSNEFDSQANAIGLMAWTIILNIIVAMEPTKDSLVMLAIALVLSAILMAKAIKIKRGKR